MVTSDGTRPLSRATPLTSRGEVNRVCGTSLTCFVKLYRREPSVPVRTTLDEPGCTSERAGSAAPRAR